MLLSGALQYKHNRIHEAGFFIVLTLFWLVFLFPVSFQNKITRGAVYHRCLCCLLVVAAVESLYDGIYPCIFFVIPATVEGKVLTLIVCTAAHDPSYSLCKMNF